MTYYYDDGYEGNTVLGKLAHRFSLSIGLSIAVKSRPKYFRQFVAQAANGIGSVFGVMSVGCGPARDVSAFLSDERNHLPGPLTCLDFENEALQCAAREHRGREQAERERAVSFVLCARPGEGAPD